MFAVWSCGYSETTLETLDIQLLSSKLPNRTYCYNEEKRDTFEIVLPFFLTEGDHRLVIIHICKSQHFYWLDSLKIISKVSLPVQWVRLFAALTTSMVRYCYNSRKALNESQGLTKTMKSCLFLCVFLILFPANAPASKLKISIIGNQGVIENYKALVKEKGGDPFVITDYKSDDAIRPAISLLLMAQAIKLGGIDFQFDFKLSPNPGRSIVEVKKGHAVLYLADIWESLFDVSVYKSEPVIKSGQFQKGFYARENSRLIQTQPHVEEIFSAPILLETTWHKDISSLKKWGFSNIKTTHTYESMISMVALGRGELTLLEFPNDHEMVHYSEHGKLYPVSGIKVCFKESRHFMVSKTHPLGRKVFSALQKGLRILREQKTIRRAYTESGVFNSRVKHWLCIK